MNRFLSLTLVSFLILTCTACVGRAAPPDELPVEPESLEAAVITDAQKPPEPKQPEKPEEPEKPYVRVIDPAKPMVALTFDDGPDGTYSNEILDILEENHALATFFEVGNNVRACPEPVKRMADMGCEVASHSNAHKNLSKMKKAALLKDLDAADEAFVAAGVDAPTMVRPPYGAVNKTVKTGTGRSMVTWTVDTEDWKSRNAETVVDYVKNYGDLDGEIVLMHSIYKSTADAVRVLVPWLQEQGYQLVTVTELMAFYYGELPQPDHFYGYTYFSTRGRTDTPVELPSMFPPEGSEDAAEEETPVEPEAPAEEPEPEAPPEETVPDVMPEWLRPRAPVVTAYLAPKRIVDLSKRGVSGSDSAPEPEPESEPEPEPEPAPEPVQADSKEEPVKPREELGSDPSLPNPALFMS